MFFVNYQLGLVHELIIGSILRYNLIIYYVLDHYDTLSFIYQHGLIVYHMFLNTIIEFYIIIKSIKINNVNFSLSSE